jgi:large subunit ribosomal protein L15
MQRRLPKFGFNSRMSKENAEVRLHELEGIADDIIDVSALRAAGVVGINVLSAKVILSGKISKAVRLRGILVTKGARAAIEAVGGKIED